MFNDKCYNCGEFGHSARNCPKGTLCHKCKKPGHISKNCPLLKNNNSLNKASNNNNPNEKYELKCYNCGKPGHKKEECPDKKGKCFLCGKPGHIKANCPNKNNKEIKEENKEEKNAINDDENNIINCPICFSNSSSGKKFKVSNCGHIICKDCCDLIFKNTYNSKCPICKNPVNKNNFMDIFI